MSADPFTEAARAEAEARYPRAADGRVPQDRWPFKIGAGWARAHLAAQEGHRRVRKYADDWDTCMCGYDAWPCRSQEATDAEEARAALVIQSQQAMIDALAQELMGRAQEPTDGEVGAFQKCLYERTLTWVPTVEVRAALSAARATRRDEEKR